MSSGFLIGFDVGGSGGRCLLVEIGTGQVWTAARPLPRRVACDARGVRDDLLLDALWERLAEASREVLERSGARPEQVAGVAAGSMRFGSVLLDAEGNVLLAAPNRDARGAACAIRLAAEHGSELAQCTGLWPAPILPLARALWLLDEEPDAAARASCLLPIDGWLAWRLCGELATDPTQAGVTGLFDLRRRAWAGDWAERLGLRHELLPDVRPTGAPLGRLGADAARAFGLRAGTPVAVGGGDSQCGLLGCGALEAGDVGIVAGTSVPVQRVTDRPVVDPEHRLWSGLHPLTDRWVVESNAGPVGESLEWLGRILQPDAPNAAARLLAEAAAEPDAGGVWSSFGAQVMDARAMQLPVGDLTLSHLAVPDTEQARARLARAVIEGAAFAVRANAEQIDAVVGAPRGRVCATGGLTQSQVWNRVLAEALDGPLEVGDVPEGTALGAAICAGAGAGVFASLTEGARALGRTRYVERPDPQRSERAAARYAEWKRLREARAPSAPVAFELALPSVLQAQAASPGREPLARPRILVTADLDEAGLALLRELGPVEHRSFREHMDLLTGARLVEALSGCDVFITEVDVVDAASLVASPHLRVVVACRGDAVNVDVPACTALGIPVLHAPGRNAGAVADLTLTFLLMLARRLPRADRFLRDPSLEAGDMGRMGQAFRELRGSELWRKTVGLVGFGAVGREVARRVRACGAHVLVSDPNVASEAIVAAGAEPANQDELLARSDFVSLHAAVTDATRGLLDVEALARMKPGAFLVNTARAALVDEEALAEAVRSGRLAGAALDVFSVEPPGADHPLLALENVIATPHVGGNTEEVGAHQAATVAADLARMLRGEEPHHVLDRAALDGFDWTRPRPEPRPDVLEGLAERPGPAVSDLQRQPAAPRRAASEVAVVADEIAAPMRRLLERFVENLCADESLHAFAAGKDVTLHFVLSDLGLEFHFGLHDGAVEGALGAPASPPEVELKMRADILDGMFTGRVNAMQSAMSGKLSFSGDTVKAMTLQEIQPDLSRLYREARDEVGDPGDLAALPDPSADEAVAAPVPLTPGDVREELVRTVRELYASDLITATGGNVSVRIPDAPDELWITPSALFKGDLRPEILVRIGVDGSRLDASTFSPSSERLMHCAVYAARPDAQAVVHAHAPHATILANAELPFLPVSTEAAFFGDIPRIPFIMPGTEELAKAVAEAMAGGWAVLMQNHGLLVAGRSLRRAADMVEIIDRSAQIILGCYAVGREPPVLPEDVVETLKKMGDLVA